MITQGKKMSISDFLVTAPSCVLVVAVLLELLFYLIAVLRRERK